MSKYYYIDAAGRKREEMGYYTLSKPNLHRSDVPVLVQARDKASAANKINKEYKLHISPSNLRQVTRNLFHNRMCKMADLPECMLPMFY